MGAGAISALEFETTGTQSFFERELALQLVGGQLKVRNALLRSVAEEFLTFLAEQLRRPPTGHFAMSVKLEDDQLARGLLRGSVELLEEVNEVPINFDRRRFHTGL